MKQAHVQQHDGATLGGFVRCPVLLDSPYGGFSFYSHHLIEIEGEIFGRYPKSVQAFQNGKKITVMDKRYILCFAAGMTVEDIADFMSLEPASVYTVRYRLKKKFPTEYPFPY
jgi:hypothetical protein